MSERDMAHINTQMGIVMREIGIMISRMGLELITTRMGTFIRESGQMGNLMGKETTSILETRVCTRATGNRERRKALENW